MENVAKKVVFEAPKGDYRDVVVDYFKKEASVEWTPREDFKLTWNHVGDYSVSIDYKKGVPHRGLVYANEETSVDAFTDFIDENGEYSEPKGASTSDNINLEYFDESPGVQCVSSIVVAVQQLINFAFYGTLKPNPERFDTLQFVGKLKKPDKPYVTSDVWEINSEDKVYEAYAKLKKGDILYRSIYGSGHARVVDHVEVVRDEKGDIDSENSFIFTYEQTNCLESKKDPEFIARNGYDSTWWMYHSYPFDKVYVTEYMPITLSIYTNGEKSPDAVLTLDKANTPENISTSLVGTVSCNFPISYLYLSIKDENGKEISHKYVHHIERLRKYNEIYSIDLSDFHSELIANAGLEEGKKYNYSLTAGIARGKTEFENFDFVYKK